MIDIHLFRLGIGPGRNEEERNTEEEVNDYLGRAIDARSIDRLRSLFYDAGSKKLDHFTIRDNFTNKWNGLAFLNIGYKYFGDNDSRSDHCKRFLLTFRDANVEAKVSSWWRHKDASF